jgi:hypothetical protein
VYRQTSCTIEVPLVDKLARGESTLKERVREKQWDADWDACEHHRRLAEDCRSRGDLPGAFREYCRSLLVLTAALQRHRGKEDVFQPIWEEDQV